MKSQFTINKESKSAKNTLISNLVKRNLNQNKANAFCVACEAGGSGNGF